MQKKKSFKIIISLFAFILLSNIMISAKEFKPPIFMGEVLEVNMASDGKTQMVKVKGYLKSCKVYEEELIALVGEETKFLNECGENATEDKNNTTNKNEKVKIEKGDIVYIVLSKAFTNSIPPQSFAKKILVSKPVK